MSCWTSVDPRLFLAWVGAVALALTALGLALAIVIVVVGGAIREARR